MCTCMQVHALFSGILLACDYEAGQEVLAERAYVEFAEFFQRIFEVTRRWELPYAPILGMWELPY